MILLTFDDKSHKSVSKKMYSGKRIRGGLTDEV